MTKTILNLFFLGVFGMIAYTLFSLVKSMVSRRHVIPVDRKEWGAVTGDLATIGACIFLLFILNKNYQEPMEAVMQFKNKPLPAFTFYNTKTGREETLDNYKNKTVILNIWATWCPPCRREMPDLEKLQTSGQKQGVEIIAISDEEPSVIRDFLANNPYSFNTSWFTSSNDLINSIQTRPVSILIKNGEVSDIVIGSRGFGFFKNWVKE
jgi:thiol-disulfide isomerase/thioredoxin